MFSLAAVDATGSKKINCKRKRSVLRQAGGLQGLQRVEN